MLKEAIKYVWEKAQAAKTPEFGMFGDDAYIDGKRLEYDRIETLSMNSLDALVKYTKVYLMQDKANLRNVYGPINIFVNGSLVTVKTGLDPHGNRQNLIECRPNQINFDFGYYMPVEKFLIGLTTCFIHSPNVDKLVESLSTLVKSDSVKVTDNGISQQITTEGGFMVGGEVKLNPIVKLQPCITYTEIQQPEIKYLIRLNDRGNVALFEADGGVWNYSMQKDILSYLMDELEDEIISGDVNIIG